MKFTYRWLLQHIDTDLSPQAIGERLTQAGLELEGLTDLHRDVGHDLLPGYGDTLFELSLTPNRGDCLGVRGIARELGALTGTALRPLSVRVVEVDEPPVAIHIQDGVGCPRYAGRIIRGVRIGPSPEWLRLYLEAVGLRSINNVVDITNFVLLDLNQPLHAFDLGTVQLPLQVRRAQPGEVVTTLDGVDRVLDAEMTVIADTDRALAVAGVMGGAVSAVTSATTAVLLESAYFAPTQVTRTGRRLGINSDSRYRFERGTDPEGIRLALDVATHWILELAGGQAGPATVVDAGTWNLPAAIVMRPQRINRLGGIELDPVVMVAMLEQLGCRATAGVAPLPAGSWLVQPPSHRHDLRREEDLLEEIIRLHGYDRIPATLPRITVQAADHDDLAATVQKLRRVLSGRGYLEAINYAFVSSELQQQLDPEIQATALLNPISTDFAVLRTSLVAGLLESARRNVSRGNQCLRLFELGRVFLPDADGALAEPHRLAGLLSGPVQARSWHTPSRETDFFDLKGDLECVLRAMGWHGVVFDPSGPAFLHPGRKATLMGENRTPLGWIGQLHPAMQEQLELGAVTVQCFELTDLALTMAGCMTAPLPVVSRFPAVQRDFAFVVPADLPAQPLLDAIRQVDTRLIRSVTLFDVYTGQHVAAGYKSLALGVYLQADDRTLTEQEVQGVAEQVVARMATQFGVTLRC